jgi:hypothetical protein
VDLSHAPGEEDGESMRELYVPTTSVSVPPSRAGLLPKVHPARATVAAPPAAERNFRRFTTAWSHPVVLN